MYYLLLLLTLTGCAGAPYDAINDSDAASDGGDVGDLLGGRQHDSATDDGDAGMDQVADADATTEPGMDAAVTPGTDAAVTDMDAATPDVDAATQALGTTCDSCMDNADCAAEHTCKFRSQDQAKVCMPGPFSVSRECDDFAPDLYPGVVFSNPPVYSCTLAGGGSVGRTCASWRAEWK